MNVVVLSGEIVSYIDFKFIYNKDKREKHISIAKCQIKLDNGSIIKVHGYDKIADYLYSTNLRYIFAEGKIDGNMEIEILEIRV